MNGGTSISTEYTTFAERRIAAQMCKLERISRAGNTTTREPLDHLSGGWIDLRDARRQLHG